MERKSTFSDLNKKNAWEDVAKCCAVGSRWAPQDHVLYHTTTVVQTKTHALWIRNIGAIDARYWIHP